MHFLFCLIVFAFYLEACSSDNSGIGPNCPTSLVDSGFYQDHVAVRNGKCYMFVARPKLTWQQAGASCRRTHHTGRLVTIHDEETQLWLIKVMREQLMWRRYRVWIGLNDQRLDHTFEWADGDHPGYSKVPANRHRQVPPEARGVTPGDYEDLNLPSQAGAVTNRTYETQFPDDPSAAVLSFDGFPDYDVPRRQNPKPW